MSVIFLPNEKHRQLSENPEGRYLIFVIMATAAIITLAISINSMANRLYTNPKAIVNSVESGTDRGATEVTSLAQNDPRILKLILSKDGTLRLMVSNAVGDKQAIAVYYVKVARLKHSTTIKMVIVESPDGDRSSPEFP